MPQNSTSRNQKPAGTGAKPTSARGNTGARGRTTTKPGAPKPGASKPGARTGGSGGRPGGRPPGKSKSIVAKRQRPWGLIITSVIVVVFAAGVIGFAVSRTGKSTSTANAAYIRDEIAAAKAIPGVIYKKEPNHTHVTKKVNYDSSPPVGGNHAQYWADCTGTVYPNQIANENAVHSLEHGAVWITYRPGLAAGDVATLAKQVTGIDRMLMTPYAGLKTAISLQAWDYQLFVDSATDPRIAQFIKALKFNPGTTPEPQASCSDPAFKTKPSTPANPMF